MTRLDEIAQQRSREARGEPVRYVSFLPESDAEAAAHPSVTYREGYEYYMKIARHPNSTGKYAFTSLGLQMAFFPFEQMETISPRPVLLVAGSKADTLFMSRTAYDKAREPRELFLVPGASHIDLYYKPEFVPGVVTKLKEFFGKALR
ncbi:MAG: alpha/beta hydrolase [Holophaga sp.]|nr:alpha/beta hydrolase [Holophaga sp.]